MTDNEKTIFTLMIALTERVFDLSDEQLAINRVLSELPSLDVSLRQTLRDAVAHAESMHDQNQAFLAAVKDFSLRQ
jgi:hypothetical protein